MFERRPSDSRIDLSGLRIRSGFSSGVVATYATILRDTYLASEVWPLVNIVAGTTISAFVNSARNGTETGWALQSAAGPVVGTLAPLSGTGDHGNILTSNGSTGLVDIFNPSMMSLFLFQTDTSWDGVDRWQMELQAGGSNRFIIRRNSVNHQFFYIAGGTNKNISVAHGSTAGWFSIGMSVDTTAGEMKAFKNGVQIGTTQTSLGVWAGALSRAVIGAETTAGANPHSGLLAYAAFKFGSIWTPANFAAMHTAASTAGPDV